jgi:hypothetical protein
MLIALMGPSTYKLATNLLSPAKSSFEDIVAVLTVHYSPTPSEVMQRFRFNSRSQKTGESVSTYIAELHRLVEHCQFGATLEKMIRDCLVCGIKDEGIQKKLLAEQDLTYAASLRIAQGMETDTKNLKKCGIQASEGQDQAGLQGEGPRDWGRSSLWRSRTLG